MVMKVKAPVFERKLVPEGQHLAVCSVVADLGLQKSDLFDKIQHQVYFQWLFPNERIEIKDKDLPMALSKRVTMTWDDRGNLLKLVESWLGKKLTSEEKEDFDLESLAGMPASIFVKHQDGQKGTVAKILDVAPYKGAEPLQIENENDGNPVIYNSDHLENLELLPKWLQDDINNQVFPNDPEVVDDEPPI